MTAWAEKHNVQVVETPAQAEPAPQKVIAGRYGRH
jgi:hypothetical protein